MTPEDPRTHGGPVYALILEVFRLNGRLLAVGDRLVAKLGLTSARWQVLAAIAVSPVPEPVARIARGMGLRRQGVRRIVNELAEDGIVAFKENPHHLRANLVVLTEKGRLSYEAVREIETPWMRSLSEGIDPQTMDAATRIVATLRERLEKMEQTPE
jgi:DNA-binding MarR family transcriptional regulator